MDAAVTLAAALAVLTVAVAAVGARALLKALRSLRGAVADAALRLRPLADELQAELAVAELEIDSLQRQIEREKPLRR